MANIKKIYFHASQNTYTCTPHRQIEAGVFNWSDLEHTEWIHGVSITSVQLDLYNPWTGAFFGTQAHALWPVLRERMFSHSVSLHIRDSQCFWDYLAYDEQALNHKIGRDLGFSAHSHLCYLRMRASQHTHAIQTDWLLPSRGADYLRNSGNQFPPVWAEAKLEARRSWGDSTNERLN